MNKKNFSLMSSQFYSFKPLSVGSEICQDLWLSVEILPYFQIKTASSGKSIHARLQTCHEFGL